jgi:hypothetical protein
MIFNMTCSAGLNHFTRHFLPVASGKSISWSSTEDSVLPGRMHLAEVPDWHSQQAGPRISPAATRLPLTHQEDSEKALPVERTGNSTRPL